MEIKNKWKPQNEQEAELCKTKDGDQINGLGLLVQPSAKWRFS